MKKKIYVELLQNIESLIEGESDIISVMSTISCELYYAFEHFNWVGFYRLVDEKTLKVGPYQGTHGCLTIDIEKGVCGKCVKEGKAQIEKTEKTKTKSIFCSCNEISLICPPGYIKILFQVIIPKGQIW